MPTAPTLTDVKAYLGTEQSYADADISRALAAEISAQNSSVRFPADPTPPAEPLPYPNDLKEALFRRVARNLAMKALPLGYQSWVTEGGVIGTRVGSDPEVRRLEAPYRRVVLG